MNDNKKLFLISLFLLFLLILFDTIAKIYSFYYFHPHADILMHLLGGIFTTSIAISILKYLKINNRFNIFIIILFLSLFWEYIEYKIGKSIPLNYNFWFNTFSDLLMDSIGGIIAYICFYKIFNQRKHQKNLQK